MSEVPRFHPVVIAPTFDNARTLAAVLKTIGELGWPVIVVDDGCRDGSADILRGVQAASNFCTVLTHSVNRGKAAALRTGFEHAAAMGFTHAVTIDTDGQHDPAQISDLLRDARRFPQALVIGRRDASAAGYPAASRAGRFWSNICVRWESGLRVSDSQCGFRVYPLATTLSLRCLSGRYGFETEVLTRAAWAGVAVAETAVACLYDVPGGRITHFRRWRDSLAGAGMHARLLLRSCLPWPVRRITEGPEPETGTIWRRFCRWVSPWRAWRALRHDPRERSHFAWGLAVGVFIANLPLYGVQTALSLYAARRLRLNPLPVVAGSHLSTPPIGPVLVMAAIAVGHWVTHGTLPALNAFDPAKIGYIGLLRTVLLEWVIGSLICGTILAATAGVITHALLRLLPWRMAPAPAVPPAAPLPTLDHATPRPAA
jgi:uncharacterized protein (DUF2062 family)